VRSLPGRPQRQRHQGLLAPPSELLADYDPGQPELQWTCALCGYRCFVPTWLEDHTAAAHPGWVARFEVVRPYPRQLLRVVYRQVTDQGSGEG
jgi:hypothetical protein